uniref:Uncharacterized protein n=1 Tax=Chromera velia CCMP2878 TaxID=1169474 RepID=A0A0G4I9C8_9ALVE|eukprot:Cvel_2017.t1-p1 / transcript=Cvel_2017.t1 / gene=Cvel_2017 / organism=Chromera_velia_CCMP2878 / gene_product=hypothetical protein / transcript_product=hypothetical protein / location=Cvel_scaffold77:91814-97116(-) / protein_length=552 / sequence_SO=supercontig / SO=protein_coding / is_pseudo=false
MLSNRLLLRLLVWGGAAVLFASSDEGEIFDNDRLSVGEQLAFSSLGYMGKGQRLPRQKHLLKRMGGRQPRQATPLWELQQRTGRDTRLWGCSDKRSRGWLGMQAGRFKLVEPIKRVVDAVRKGRGKREETGKGRGASTSGSSKKGKKSSARPTEMGPKRQLRGLSASAESLTSSGTEGSACPPPLVCHSVSVLDAAPETAKVETETEEEKKEERGGRGHTVFDSAFSTKRRRVGGSTILAAAQETATETEEEKKEEGGGGGHAVPNSAQKTIPPEEAALQARIQEHQANAARLSPAEDARSLVEYSTGYGTLSTISSSLEGFPGAGVVAFGLDEEGKPIFCVSTMSSHTQDILKNPNVALTVTASGFKGSADGRVVLIGTLKRLLKEESGEAKALYSDRHPKHFWVQFGDFLMFKMEKIEAVRYVGGFARAESFTAEEYSSATPDPIMQFAQPVMTHMNEDHSDATKNIVLHATGFPAQHAEIVNLDRLGMTVKCGRKEDEQLKLRIPFPRPAESRKDIKELLVQMTREAAQAAAGSKGQGEETGTSSVTSD